MTENVLDAIVESFVFPKLTVDCYHRIVNKFYPNNNKIAKESQVKRFFMENQIYLF